MLTLTCVLLLGLVANARADMESYIVGGSYADIRQHSHSAALSIKCIVKGVKSAWICGASVVNQKILLTAGHCLHECSIDSHIAINLGNNNREKGLRYSTFGFVVHEDYISETCSNDVGLVKTNAAFPLGTLINRVALLRRPPYSERATVAGWGVIDEELTWTEFLKSVPQKILSRDKCLDVYGVIPKGTFCAASLDRHDEYPTQGDSGSALIVRGYIELGLVSYKTTSVSENVIVYTDVGYFYDWIKTNTKRLFCFT